MNEEKRLIDANELKKRMLALATAWRTNVLLVDAIIDRIDTESTVDAVEVVFCDNCVNHGNCLPENVFRIAKIEKPYCCIGKMDGDRNG